MMMQRLVIALVRTIATTFFRRIDVVGIENVPADGPVIFAGNHPNALMDGWLLTAKCGRWPLHFMVNAKLWKFPILGRTLDAMGAVPVYPREEHGGDVDNEKAFHKLYEVIESGNCMGVFPEGVSHVESQLTTLKTGTARIALSVAARGNVSVTIVPCGLNYINRHRFRSQVLIEFGAPIEIDQEWLEPYRKDEQATVRALTGHLAQALLDVTLNAPDWRTLRFIQTARRLYKPASAQLSPGQYVELSRRFVDQYLESANDPGTLALRDEIEDYQSHIEMLGLKDHQLRQPLEEGAAFRRIVLRSLRMLVLLPLALPGALLHLPIGWVAATVGEKFSYEMDDVATLKVFATIALLPLLYVVIGVFVAVNFGFLWAAAAVLGLALSFFASVRVLEAEASLFKSVSSLLRVARLQSDVEELRATRASLVSRVRARVDRYTDSDTPRIFTNQDFATNPDD